MESNHYATDAKAPNMNDLKHFGDGAALVATIGTLLGWLPYLAALLSAIWTGIRIWEWWKARK